MAKARKGKGARRRKRKARGQRKADSRSARMAAKAKALATAAQKQPLEGDADTLGDNRNHRRYELHHPLHAKCATWSQFLKVYTRNISTGGMFLAVDELPEIGTRLELRFDLPNYDRLILHAHVAHVIEAEHAATTGQVMGFGIELDPFTLEEEAVVESLVLLAEKHVAAPPPPLPMASAPRGD